MTVDSLIIGTIAAEPDLSAFVKTFAGGLTFTKAFRGTIPTTYYDPVLKQLITWTDKLMLPAMTYQQIGTPRSRRSVYTVFHYQISVWHTSLGQARALGIVFDTMFNGIYGNSSDVALINVTKTNEQDYISEVSGRYAYILDYNVNIRG